MLIHILSPVRLFGEGVGAYLSNQDGIVVGEFVSDFGALRRVLTPEVRLVLVDVTAGFDAEEVRSIACDNPELLLVAVGLKEQRDEVVQCGRAGFAAYVPRSASLEILRDAILAAGAGRLTMPADIACGLMRALFHGGSGMPAIEESALTRREAGVLRLLGRGLSNKEIARELDVKVPTVKHHVHSILSKLGVASRGQAMRRVREAPWVA